MQYSRKDIIEEIKKIFEQSPSDTTASDLDRRARKARDKKPLKTPKRTGPTSTAVEKTGTSSSGASKTTAKSDAAKATKEKAAKEKAAKEKAERTKKEKAKADAVAQRITGLGGAKFWARLDGEYEVKVKTVMALQNRNWWEKPVDWDDEYYEETETFSARDKDTSGLTNAKLDYDTTAAEPYEDMYRRQGYSQVYQNVRRVLMRPGAVDYQSAAAENLVQQASLIKPRIPYFINVSHNMHSKRVSDSNKSSHISSGMAPGATVAPKQKFFHKHPLNDAKNKKLVVKTIERSLAPAKEGGEFVIGIPYFYWPNYGSSVGAPVTTNSEFAVICLYPMFASDKYASKDYVVVRAIPFRTRQSIALGIGAAFYNWTWAEGFGDLGPAGTRLSVKTIQKGDENKFNAMTNRPGEFSVMANQSSIINKKIDGHIALLNNFIKHLNKSIADKQVVSDCTKIVNNYVKYLSELRKHTVFLSSTTRNYADMAMHWVPLINYGGIVSDAQKALWPGAQK
tara:strand:+ start:1095 stop:2624 length:1530 start_codon:yes stop_codon:yes gene_type:complete